MRLAITIVNDDFIPNTGNCFSIGVKLAGGIGQVEDMLESYAGKYFVLKAPRKLKWRRLQGNVELALTIGDKVVDYTVSPILATLLYHFQVGPEFVDYISFCLGACKLNTHPGVHVLIPVMADPQV
jgi:hypothetical protein